MRSVAITIMMLLVAYNAYGQLNGTISVKTPNDATIVFDRAVEFFPGETVTIKINGTVNINPEIRYREECTKFLGFKIHCEDVPYPVNHYFHATKEPKLPATVYIRDSEENVVVGPVQISDQAYTVKIPHMFSKFNQPVKITGYMAGDGIDRGKSIGTYSVHVSVDAGTRVTLLENFIIHVLDNNLDVDMIKAGLTPRLRKENAQDVAAKIADYLSSTHYRNLNQAKKAAMDEVVKYVVSSIDSENNDLQLKVASIYAKELNILKADQELNKLLIKLSGREQDYKTIELKGHTYVTLGDLYASKNQGLIKGDLTKAAEFYHQGELCFQKAANTKLLTLALLKQTEVLKKINSVSSLRKAKNKLAIALQYSKALYPVIRDDRVGYCDVTGGIIIKASYEDGLPFDPLTNLASVQLNGKWGAIDKGGKVVVPFEYDDQILFYQSLIAPFEKDGKVGFIDRTGKIIHKAKFEFDSVAGGYLAPDIKGTFHPQTNSVVQGSVFHNVAAGGYTFRSGNAIGLLDDNGNVLIPAECSYIEKLRLPNEMFFSLGGSIVSMSEVHGLKNFLRRNMYRVSTPSGVKIVDDRGQTLYTSASYSDKILYVDEHKVIVSVSNYMSSKIIQFENEKQSIVFDQPGYSEAFQDGVVVHAYSDVAGLSRDWGKNFVSVPYKYLYYDNFNFFAMNEQRKFALLDNNLNQLTDFKFDELEGSGFGPDHAILRAKLGPDVAYLDRAGNYIMEPTQKEATIVGPGLYQISDSSRIYIFTKNGLKLFETISKELVRVEPLVPYKLVKIKHGLDSSFFDFDTGSNFHFTDMELPWVKTREGWSLIDFDSKYLTETRFDSVEVISPGILFNDKMPSIVFKDSKSGLFVGKQLVISPQYDRIAPIFTAFSIKEHLKNLADLNKELIEERAWYNIIKYEVMGRWLKELLLIGYTEPYVVSDGSKFYYLLSTDRNRTINLN